MPHPQDIDLTAFQTFTGEEEPRQNDEIEGDDGLDTHIFEYDH